MKADLSRRWLSKLAAFNKMFRRVRRCFLTVAICVRLGKWTRTKKNTHSYSLDPLQCDRIDERIRRHNLSVIFPLAESAARRWRSAREISVLSVRAAREQAVNTGSYSEAHEGPRLNARKYALYVSLATLCRGSPCQWVPFVDSGMRLGFFPRHTRQNYSELSGVCDLQHENFIKITL